MFGLNIPKFDYKLKKKDGQLYIYDVVRKKYFLLTKEEWVRQSVIHWINKELCISLSLFRVEQQLSLYQNEVGRFDILIHAQEGYPKLIIECKSPEIELSEVHLSQITTYQKHIQAKGILLTNGLIHFVYLQKNGEWKKMVEAEETIELLRELNFPPLR